LTCKPFKKGLTENFYNKVAVCLNFDANKVGRGPHKPAEVVALKEDSYRASLFIFSVSF
jgi:hypothetical protein